MLYGELRVNKTLLKERGPRFAVFMASIEDVFLTTYDEQYRHEHDPSQIAPPQKQISHDGFILITNEELRNLTGMSNHELLNCKKEAERDGFLEIEKRGIPAKQHYRILKRQ